MGRPAFAPSAEQRKQVETMAGYGIPEEDIALVLGIDPKTLRKHFRLELERWSSDVPEQHTARTLPGRASFGRN